MSSLEDIKNETVDLEKIPIEEVFQQLKCSREGLTTQEGEAHKLDQLVNSDDSLPPPQFHDRHHFHHQPVQFLFKKTQPTSRWLRVVGS
jgi:hypothetical protein